MKELEKQKLILNEYQVIDEIVRGIREVPEYYYSSLLVGKLYTYFKQNGVDDILTSIADVLDTLGYDFTTRYLDSKIRELNDRKQYKLHELKESIKIYQSEVDMINKLESIYSKKLAFSILLLTKISNYKRPAEKKDNCTYYYQNAYLLYIGLTQDKKYKTYAFHELQQAGIITVPLTDYGFYCNIVANDGEVVYEVVDDFENGQKHFNKCFDNADNKVILEVKVDSDEHVIHHGYTNINKNRKAKGEKAVVVNNIHKCCKFEKMSINGSYWVEITDEIENDMSKINQIKNELRRIAKYYRKMTKQIGFSGIQEEFKKFMDAL